MVKDMTNTRRKTFPDPLSFWQWAIEDSMRQAQNSIGHRFMVQVSPSTGAVISWRAIGLQGGAFGPTDSDCPLTAVEDEHGVIEEENPQFSATSEISAHLFDAAQSLDKEGCYKSARQAAHFIKMLIREEIAAATVEMIPYNREDFQARGDVRLKPKGDV